MCDESCIKFGEKCFQFPLDGKRVLEMGSRDVNGSVKDNIMRFGPGEYIGIDIEHGPNVDILCKAEDTLDMFSAESFDVVVCTEMMEHVYDWRKVINNMKQLCRPEGYILVTTRSFGFEKHGWPNDYWRYEIQDMQRIFADFPEVIVEDDWQHPGVFVFAKKPKDFKMIDLKGINLYNMVIGKRAI